jgi:hypothetical protein
MIHLVFMVVMCISLLFSTNAWSQPIFKSKIELEDITPAWLNFCPSDLHVSGDYLFGVDFEVFNVYDISNLGMPVWKNSFREYGGCDLVVADGYAFVSYHESVVAFDVDPVETMKELSRVKIPDYPYQMCLYGIYLYVFSDDMDQNRFLHIIDVSDPAKIVKSGELKLDRDIQTFEVYDEKTLVATNPKGIVIIDTSDPKTPKISKTLEGEISPSEYGLTCSHENNSQIVISDGYAYATFGEPEINIFDIDPIESAHYVGCLKFENTARIVGLKGNILYTEDIKDYDDRKLQAVDISNKESPVIIQTYNVTDPIPYLKFREHYAYSNNVRGGMTVFDFSYDKLPITHLTACAYLDVLSGNNDLIYAASSKQLMVIDVSDPHKASVVNTIEPMEGIQDILFKDDLMILIYERKIQLAETDGRGNVNIVKTIDFDWNIESPICIGDYLYFLSSYGMFSAINLKIPSLAFIEFNFGDFDYHLICKAGDFLLADKSGQLDFLRFAEGNKLELLHSIDFETPFCSKYIVVDGEFAFVFSDYYGFKVLNISNPGNPFIVAGYREFEYQKGLVLDDFIFFEIDYNDAWGVWYKEPFIKRKDVTEVDALFISPHTVRSTAKDMFIMGDCIYIASYDGLRIYDLSRLSTLPPYSDGS